MLQSGSYFRDGGASFEKYGIAVEDEVCCFSCDGLLFFAIGAAKRVIRGLKIRCGRLGDCSAMGANQQSLAFEISEVAPDRRSCDAERINQLGCAYSALPREELGDSKSPFFRQHGLIFLRYDFLVSSSGLENATRATLLSNEAFTSINLPTMQCS